MIYRKGYKRRDGSKGWTKAYYCRIRQADGTLREFSTGCRDKGAARQWAADKAKEQERIAAGVVLPAEIQTARHGCVPYSEMVGAFAQNMTARGCSASHAKRTKAYLENTGKELAWRLLHDMNKSDLDRWLSMRAVTPKNPEESDSVMGARVHNAHVTAFKAFGTWCVQRGYVTANPFDGLAKRNEKADRRHVRRALSPEELGRLFEAAAVRPVQEALKGNAGRGGKMKKAQATLSEATLANLRFLGWTRALAYKTAAYTGLRWGELRSITIGAACLDNMPPYLELAAKDEKARRGAQIPLQDDLASELGEYLAERIARLQGDCSAFPGAFDEKTLFENLPQCMAKIFDADCVAAGIPKYDGAGRVIDVHALRHTFGTMLAKAGVPLQVAQRAMRHSTPTLTANVYTHLELMDIAGAANQLPRIATPAASLAVHVMGKAEVASSITHTKMTSPQTSPKTRISAPQAASFCTIDSEKSDRENAEKSSKNPEKTGVFDGGPCRIRTCDQVIMSHLL